MLRNTADELLGPSMLQAELAASDIAEPAWAAIFDAPRSAAEHVVYRALTLALSDCDAAWRVRSCSSLGCAAISSS